MYMALPQSVIILCDVNLIHSSLISETQRIPDSMHGVAGTTVNQGVLSRQQTRVDSDRKQAKKKKSMGWTDIYVCDSRRREELQRHHSLGLQGMDGIRRGGTELDSDCHRVNVYIYVVCMMKIIIIGRYYLLCTRY